MIYTSYFAQMKKILAKNTMNLNLGFEPGKEFYIPISICGKAPNWYTSRQYKKVAPKWQFFKEWKENHDNEFFRKHFKEEVLDTLNPKEVLDDLLSLLQDDVKAILNQYGEDWWNCPYIHVVLLCYEKPTDFCHRHLVANWLNSSSLNVNVQELLF